MLCSKNTGLTLIELLTVLAIAGIMVTIAVPSFVSVVTKSRMNGEVSSVLGALNFARSEATKRGLSVAVCQRSGNTCAAVNDWSSGWRVVLLDPVTPANITSDLLVSSGVSRGDTLISSLTSYPQFTPAGYTFWTGSLTLQDPNSTPALYQYICFSAGNWKKQIGTACP